MSSRAKKHHWLFESPDLPYDALDVKIILGLKRKIYSGRSPYQKIGIFDTFSLGKILVLDGVFQTSEKDEFVYHEMICHLPMFCHPNPKRVLIIGGGDGGSLEEVLKHPIERAWMVEIDKKVIDLSKKYLPSISKGAFGSKKAEVIVGDGLEFIKGYKNFFDVIILDLSDPWGPARKLISLNFYKDVKKALRRGGVISVQSGSFSCQLDLVKLISRRLKKVFSSVRAHRAPVIIYGTGDFSFTVASDLNLAKVNIAKIRKRFNKIHLKTKYYLPEIQQSSAVLPRYLKEHFGS